MNNKNIKDRGFALVFLLGAFVLLCGFLALFFDYSVAATQNREAANMTSSLALGILDRYLREELATADEKKAKVLEYLTDVEKLGAIYNRQLDLSKEAKPEFEILDPGEAPKDDALNVQFGRTVMCPNALAEVECNRAKPEDNPSNWFSFEPLKDANETPNSVKVFGTFARPNTSIFARFSLGIKNTKIRTSSIATVRPRWGCFLVDLSGSMAFESNANWDGTGEVPTVFVNGEELQTSGHRFAFLENALADTGSIDGKRWKIMETLGRVTRTSDAPDHIQINYQSDYSTLWMPGDDAANDTTIHPETSDYSMGSSQEFLANQPRDGGDPEPGPEPLNSAVRGIKDAVNAMHATRTPGDRVCIIGYDKGLGWSRIIKLIDVQKNYELVNDYLDNYLTNGLFPGEAEVSATNTPDAVRTAMQFMIPFELLEDTSLKPSTQKYSPSKDEFLALEPTIFVILAGDGLTNCTSDSSGVQCNTMVLQTHEASLYSASSMLGEAGEAISKNIAASFFLFGDYIAPNTVDKERSPGSGTCYSDSEWRVANSDLDKAQEFVAPAINEDGTPNYNPSAEYLSDRYKNPTKDNPYAKINKDLYKLSLLTQGVFAPIRGVDENCDPQCVSGDKECQPDCQPGKVRLTDPSCRGKTKQIKDYMAQAVKPAYRVIEAKAE